METKTFDMVKDNTCTIGFYQSIVEILELIDQFLIIFNKMVLHALFGIVGNKMPQACNVVSFLSCFQEVIAQAMENQAREAVEAVTAVEAVDQVDHMVTLLMIYSVFRLI